MSGPVLPLNGLNWTLTLLRWWCCSDFERAVFFSDSLSEAFVPKVLKQPLINAATLGYECSLLVFLAVMGCSDKLVVMCLKMTRMLKKRADFPALCCPESAGTGSHDIWKKHWGCDVRFLQLYLNLKNWEAAKKPLIYSDFFESPCFLRHFVPYDGKKLF